MHLLGFKLNKNKSIKKALRAIYGLNNFKCDIVTKKLGFSDNLKLKNITNIQSQKLTFLINLNKNELSVNLRKENYKIFKNLMAVKSIRGLRLNKGLPVRGQRTHTNAKTARKKLFFKPLLCLTIY